MFQSYGDDVHHPSVTLKNGIQIGKNFAIILVEKSKTYFLKHELKICLRFVFSLPLVTHNEDSKQFLVKFTHSTVHVF